MSETDNKFLGCHLKIDRARTLIDDLTAAIRTYFAEVNVQISPRSNETTNSREWVITEDPKPVPATISLLAGDAVHNLRAAFDHYAFAVVSTGRLEDVAFPVWKKDTPPKPEQWKGTCSGRLPGASAAILAGVQQLQPWSGGKDEWLSTLHVLDILDKHRLLLSAAIANTGVVVDLVASLRASFPEEKELSELEPAKVQFNSATWDVATAGTVVFGDPSSWNYDEPPGFVFNVALLDIPALKNQAITEVLGGFLKATETTLARLISLA